jgi:small subunit ribosomal protein S9
MTPTKKTADKDAKEVKAPVARKAAAPKKAEAAEAPVADVMAADMKVMGAGEYIYAIGRRKRAVAKTKLWIGGKGEITVNGKKYTEYFPVYELREVVTDALRAVGQDDKVTVQAEALGGGLRGQAEALRLGISRALVELNPNYRKSLKALGYMMRDPREKERKHYGFKKARKASQWAKR